MGYLLGVQHVNLTIEEGEEALEVARKFYVDLLGLTPLYRPENTDSGRPGFWLALGESGQQIHLSMEPQANNYNGPSRRHSAFFVQDLPALMNHLEKAGVTIEGANQFPGQRRCFCRDPFGNRLELVELTGE
jgi:catechol 2,3-dioxygenase-like lactoylglutathione lyase family enzyme